MRRLRTLALVAVCLATSGVRASEVPQGVLQATLAQSFGKNKVRYGDFDWWIYETDHLKILYQPEYEPLARAAGEYLEEVYVELRELLYHDLSVKPPIVIYESHYEFEQNNIYGGFLPPGVGGFAEASKYRVATPFNGDLERFRKVLRHELAHIFQYDVLFGGPLKHVMSRLKPPPLWVMEGMAEYVAGEMHATDVMVLRDAVLSDQMTSMEYMDDFGDGRVFLGYKQAHTLMWYIEERYGVDAIRRLLRNWSLNASTPEIIRKIFKTDIYSFNEDWHNWLRRRFWPEIRNRKFVHEVAERLIHPELREKAVSYVGTAWSAGGEMLAVLANKDGAPNFDVQLLRIRDGKPMSVLTKGLRVGRFDLLKAEDRTLAWSPQGRWLAFVGRSGPRDRIFIYDLYQSTVIQTIEPESFQAVTAIAWHPTDPMIAVTGANHGQADIYLIDLTSGRETQVINTLDQDSDPAWSPDGRKLAFSSHFGRQADIVIYDTETGALDRIVHPRTNEREISWLRDRDVLVFTSDPDTVNDLHLLDLDALRLHRLTTTANGMSALSASPDDRKVAFTAYHHGRRDIYLYELPEVLPDSGLAVEMVALESIDPLPPEARPSGEGQTRKYKAKLELEGFGGGFALSNGFMEGVGEMLFTDLLGNHSLGVRASGISTFDEINDLDLLIQYGYYKHRVPFIATYFNVTDFFRVFRDNRYGQLATDTQTGIVIGTQYPFNIYRRFDFTFSAFRQSRNIIEHPVEELASKSTQLLRAAFVHDDTFGSLKALILGTRYFLAVGRTLPLSGDAQEFTQFETDYRTYLGLPWSASIALRFRGLSSFGDDTLLYFLGGQNPVAIQQFSGFYDITVAPLRGYDFSSFVGSRIVLANIEYRQALSRDPRSIWSKIFLLGLGPTDGTFFFDIGGAWLTRDEWADLERSAGDFRHPDLADLKDGFVQLKDLKAGLGVGLQIYTFLPITVEYALTTDLTKLRGGRWHFSLGPSF